MTRIEATRVVPASLEDVFAFLSDLGNHCAVAGRWIEVVALDGGGDGGRVRIRGPLGLHRTASTSVERVRPPGRLQGTALLVRTGAFDRIVLGLGGAAWMRRLFAATLAHLAERFALAATSARA